MVGVASILILLSLLGVIFGLLGVLKGSVKFLKLKSRKASAFFILGFFIVFILGIVFMPTDSTKSQVAEKTASPNTEEKQEPTKVQEEEEAEEAEEEKREEAGVKEPPPKTNDQTLEVHFVDVGQGAAQVIIMPNKKVLVIDGGDNDDEDDMVEYLRKLGVKKVDILIGTHPDADHVGGIDAVIDSFDIGMIYMPKIQNNTLTFESVLRSIQNKGLKVTTAKAGLNLDLDSTVQAKMIAPIVTTNESNEMSAVVRIEYGNHSFLLTADAGFPSEERLIQSGEELQSTVLLTGHHGSNYSTSESFLKAVKPKYTVIQVGTNSYGHPTDEVLKRLSDASVKIYRSDQNGTIVFKTDGKELIANKNTLTKKYSAPKGKFIVGNNENPNGTSGIITSASINNPQPKQNGTVTVTVTVNDSNGKPVKGANVNLDLHFKSTDTEWNGVTNSNGVAFLTFRIGRATEGFTVKGDITVNANGQSSSTSTAFTPQ